MVFVPVFLREVSGGFEGNEGEGEGSGGGCEGGEKAGQGGEEDGDGEWLPKEESRTGV